MTKHVNFTVVHAKEITTSVLLKATFMTIVRLVDGILQDLKEVNVKVKSKTMFKGNLLFLKRII